MRADVFAVEDTAVQVVVSGGAPTVTAAWPGGSVTARVGPGDPAAVIVDGLPSSTTVRITAGPVTRTVTTLAPPPGRRLSRFATLNDMHIGARSFGPLRPMWHHDRSEDAPVLCLQAALDEAVAWGADALLVKGDMTQRGRVHEWERVGELLAATGLPVVMIEGNHETKLGSVDGRTIMATFGIELAVGRALALDLPGVRLIGAPTARWHHGNGRVSPEVAESALALAGSAPEGAVVAFHHYPQRFRYPTLYPSGTPSWNAGPFLTALAHIHPASLVLAGHSHRHRRHDHGPLMVAETGSTKDFPGSWAGYTVHEGGILQTTRRVMAPAALGWTERGRRVLGGVWGVWAPGVRSHRCFTYQWPT